MGNAFNGVNRRPPRHFRPGHRASVREFPLGQPYAERRPIAVQFRRHTTGWGGLAAEMKMLSINGGIKLA